MAVQMRRAASGAPSDEGPDGLPRAVECGSGRGVINSGARRRKRPPEPGTVTVRVRSGVIAAAGPVF
ncbi:hypothetical protein GCM10017567_71350 [Amycolatopsis bullii]|uniref:Uncharacterized protein n=1 Tax=Amycolatopsis bullii TaxID=941987 RepID=A0ABQ3KNB8_9PSEU|nr:hypothetical protein GCM10017567_71350 [Amycolatopsis bullii]